jgi:hypothetical protein
MMQRNAKLALVLAAGSVMFSVRALAQVPVSNGNVFNETFTTYPEDPKSGAIGEGAFVANGVVTIQTLGPTEGVFRASNLNIAAGAEYVLEYDVRVNAPSGDNFYLLYSEGSAPPWEQDIKMRIYNDTSTPSTWEFQVDDYNYYYQYGGYNYNQFYHVTVHHDTSNNIKVYFDGSLVGSFVDREPGMAVNLMQLGDSSGGSGYGNITLDNMRIGAAEYVQPTWNVNQSGDWNAFANWRTSYGVPNAVDAVANLTSAISSPRTIVTDSAVTLGTLKFDNASGYQVTGQGSLSIDVSSGSGSINVVQGSHKINLPLFINDNTTANIASGATLRISDPMTLVGGKTLTKIGTGTMVIESPVYNTAPATILSAAGVITALRDLGSNTTLSVSGGTTNLPATQHLAGLDVSGGSVKVGPGANVVVSTKSLSISGSGQVDLQNSKMVVDYTGSSVLSAVKSAINAGSLTSSQLTTGRAIGYGEASDLFVGPTGFFAGETVDSTSVVIAYTVTGDASLDGTVSSADFNQFVANYGKLANARWTQGDLDGDGKVTTVDFNLLAGNFGQSLPSGASLGSVVPEPASMGMIASIAMIGLRRGRQA